MASSVVQVAQHASADERLVGLLEQRFALSMVSRVHRHRLERQARRGARSATRRADSSVSNANKALAMADERQGPFPKGRHRPPAGAHWEKHRMPATTVLLRNGAERRTPTMRVHVRRQNRYACTYQRPRA